MHWKFLGKIFALINAFNDCHLSFNCLIDFDFLADGGRHQFLLGIGELPAVMRVYGSLTDEGTFHGLTAHLYKDYFVLYPLIFIFCDTTVFRRKRAAFRWITVAVCGLANEATNLVAVILDWRNHQHLGSRREKIRVNCLRPQVCVFNLRWEYRQIFPIFI